MPSGGEAPADPGRDENRYIGNRRRRLRRTVLLGLLVVVATAVLAIEWQLLFGNPEARIISAKRAAYRALWAIGQPLPGTPDFGTLDQRLAAAGMTRQQPILVRIFKREFELEIWKAKDGRFQHFATYPICRWSGQLGPKIMQGDRQAPEGFYTVGAGQLNPNSRWHRSFNLGFPNLYDHAHGRTGTFLMVHGGCGSVGCYAMTDSVIDEIWALVTAALQAGQKRFQVQALPFRLSEENLAEKSSDPLHGFWRTLKTGTDLFEATGLPPRVRVCKGDYVFLPGNDTASGDDPIAASCNGVKGRDSASEG